MSIYHSVKCTKEEAMAFRNKVRDFLLAEGLGNTGYLKALRSYDGNVRLYTGKEVERPALRKRLRFVKDNPGGGSKTYERHKDPIIEKEYTTVYRADDWEEEKEAIRNFFKRT